jgi:hypothetical protein
MRSVLNVTMLATAVWVVPAVLAAQEPTSQKLRAVRATTPPTIDGTLDDAAWQQPELTLGTWTSYNPLYGDTIPQQTHVWVAYDEEYIYIAFQCDDPQPAAVKTSITRRDNIWSDDWVGFSLDALGTGQLAYHLMVNPSGVQLDMLNSAGSGEDEAPDWVWDSAARQNAQGYAAEIRLPLQTIRFRSGDAVRMGVLFWRRVSRLGVSVSWPGLKPGQWVFQRHASLHFDRLSARPTRELIPSVTYATGQTRATPTSWHPRDGTTDVGFSGKLGLTPTITLDATVNPDFSQVESDAFQVEVNRRFPLFYSEKRPFFMEGAGLFDVAGPGGDTNLQTAVHTRRIVNPSAGLKLTGSAGRWTFGTLATLDEALPPDARSDAASTGDDRLFIVNRLQYRLSADSYLGALVTNTELGSQHNRVGGVDVNLRVKQAHQITAMALVTDTLDADEEEGKGGMAGRVSYSFDTKRASLSGMVEHYDTGFQMDTAFYEQAGLTRGWGFGALNFYPDKARYPWLRRINAFTFQQFARDRIAGGDQMLNVSGGQFYFTRQGWLRVDRFTGYEPWASRRFDLNRWRIQGEVQLFRWLELNGNASIGDFVFYDSEEPFQGDAIDARFAVTVQPSARFSQEVSIRRVDFNRRETGADVYDLWITYTKSTYQFTRAFFLRAIAQQDTLDRRVLTDFLASYELRPGTVIYAGYGSLIERHNWDGANWQPDGGRYRTMQRGLFFKASYLYRF